MTAPAGERLALLLPELQEAIDRWLSALKSSVPKGAAARQALRSRRAAGRAAVTRAAHFILGGEFDIGSVGDVVAELDRTSTIVTAEQLCNILRAAPTRYTHPDPGAWAKGTQRVVTAVLAGEDVKPAARRPAEVDLILLVAEAAMVR